MKRMALMMAALGLGLAATTAQAAEKVTLQL
jgi:hypothetical protein